MGRIEVCRYCQDRYLGCHDHCDKYKDAKARLEAEKQMIIQKKSEDSLYRDYKRKRMKKYLRQI